MKKILFSLGAAITPYVAFAHGMEDTLAEGTGLWAQIQELLPVVHWQEGHWFAVGLSIILWAALAYTAYMGIKKVFF